MTLETLQGKIIAIEGTDGAGKKTQTALLIDRLKKEGYKTSTVSFPQYGRKSAGLVEEYLNNRYGPAGEIDPYAASLFYALDRYDASLHIRSMRDSGHWVVLDRYVDSNAGHQGSKIHDIAKREAFLKWLYSIEYDILGVPQPDVVFVLCVPVAKAMEMNLRKAKLAFVETENHLDGHENEEHLKHAEATYLWLAQNNTSTHRMIQCVEEDQLLSPQEVHERVWESLMSYS